MDSAIDCADTDCDTSPACSSIIINEINYDNPGADNAEFVEIYNPGPHATNLDGVSLLLVNGNVTPPATYTPSTDLSGNTIPAGGYLVVGQANVVVASGATKVTFAGGIQNGGGPGIAAPGDAVALFDTTDKILLDAVSYEAPVLMATIAGASYDLYEGPMPPPALLVGEDDTMPDKSVVRFPNAQDTANDLADFKVTSLLTPGAANQMAEICNDTIDNDGDSFTDCADSDCAMAVNCVEVCNDGVDNNGNSQIDCAEATCNGQSCGTNGKLCAAGACGCPTGTTENCSNGMDDNCNGQSDCADPLCAADPACGEICTDNMDNNGNSLVDCADPLCNNQSCGANGLTCSGTMCTCPGGMIETCNDNIDNNCDGLKDCMDAMCSGTPACAPTGTLIISEYVEGTGNRKAIEITNRSGAAYDLTAHACVLHRYSNSSGTFSATITLSGVLPPVTSSSTGTFVVCNPSGVQPTDVNGIPASSCSMTSSSLNHNGDDSYDLTCDGAIVDFIGQINVSPSVNFAQDVTLVRKCSAVAHTTTSNMFASSEFGAAKPVDTFTGLKDSTCEP